MASRAPKTGTQLPELVLLFALLGVAVWLARGSSRSEPRAVTRATAERNPAPLAPSSAQLPGAAGEVRLLAEARRALYQGEASKALDVLKAYEATFPQRVMADDVALLRVEAHVRSGQHSAAAEIAVPLIRKDPTSPQARRARALLTSTSSAPR